MEVVHADNQAGKFERDEKNLREMHQLVQQSLQDMQEYKERHQSAIKFLKEQTELQS